MSSRFLAHSGCYANGVATIAFETLTFDEGFRADEIVEDKAILELKSIEAVHPVHKKQLLTYLRLTGLKLGYLLNFGEALMKDGILASLTASYKSHTLRLRASVRKKNGSHGATECAEGRVCWKTSSQ